MRHTQKQLGFTLVESIVSMAIGMFLILGAFTVYSQGSYSFKTIEGTSRIQENLRFAFDTLEPDVRLSGYWGLHNGSGSIQSDEIVITCEGVNVSEWVLDTYVGITARDNIQASNSNNVAANARKAANCSAFDDGIQPDLSLIHI